MRFILVRTVDDRFPGWSQWRATCSPLDYWFCLPNAYSIQDVKGFVRKKYPDATFSDERRKACS